MKGLPFASPPELAHTGEELRTDRMSRHLASPSGRTRDLRTGNLPKYGITFLDYSPFLSDTNKQRH